MKLHKNAVTMRLSEEMIATIEGFEHRGRYETIPLTDEDRAAHKRAKDALAELDSNPWVSRDYDGYMLEPLRERLDFIPEETTEEWIARWRASKTQ